MAVILSRPQCVNNGLERYMKLFIVDKDLPPQSALASRTLVSIWIARKIPVKQLLQLNGSITVL